MTANAASRPEGAAALFQRLTALEAAGDSRYRQPAAVLEAIARAWSAGATLTETAASAGVSREIIRARLRRAGALEYRARNGAHVREVFERCGAELVAAYEAGASIAALAAEAGVGRQTLSTFLVARGVRLRHDRGWYRRAHDPLGERSDSSDGGPDHLQARPGPQGKDAEAGGQG